MEPVKEKKEKIAFEDVKKDGQIVCYIQSADRIMQTMGYTEHSFPHVSKVAADAGKILDTLGYPARVCELARIAGYLHDIGNVINRAEHAQSGAVMAFTLLNGMGMEPEEIGIIVSAIGNHDEETAFAVNEVAAALILADKSDVRRTRVRIDPARQVRDFDIHDRVNYSVHNASMEIDPEKMTASLKLRIDTSFCAVMEFFEIFLERMILCRRAAEFLRLHFKLIINESELL